MKKLVYMVTIGFAAFIVFGAAAHSKSLAGDPAPVYMMGGGMSGGMGGGMGGGGIASMGGGIMDFVMKLLNPNKKSDKEALSEREEMRSRIQEKRSELASLLHSEHPDRDLIDRKIKELNRLEERFDREMSASN